MTSGTVELKPTGDWDYEIYEQTSATSLTIAGTTTLLEQGIIRVIGSSDSTTSYNSQDKTYTFYGTGSS